MSSTILEPEQDVLNAPAELPDGPALDSSDTEPADGSAAETRRILNEAFSPERMSWKWMSWGVLGWMVLMHAGALAAPFFFTWQAVAVCVVMHWLTCSIGICLGYHRYLSHRSMKLRKPAEFFTMLCGVLSGEGSPLNWSATHRLHHQRSDLEGDPHSPTVSGWWSHLLWMFVRQTPAEHDRLYRRYVPDLLDRPMMRFFEWSFFPWLMVSAAVLYAVGGLPFLLWGLCARMVFAYHSTWFVNSATHLWGYRNYETTDHSRNLWWVAILAYGEGWHNNHHAHPSVAPAGHRWWEVDITWWSIRLLRAVGQAYDVKDRIPSREAAK